MFQLPEYVTTSTSVHAEYPAAACLSEDMWLVSDGHGVAFLIHIPDDQSPAKVLASWELLINNAAVPSPFQLHNATIVAPHLAIAIVSSPSPASSEPSSSKGKEQPMFDIWAVHVPLTDTSISSPVPFEVKWRRRGTNIPLSVKYLSSRDAFLFIGGSSYYDIGSQPVQPYDPATDELVPIPRAGDINDTATVTRPPPYSWTQTDDTVTVAFALPGTTPKTSIHAIFQRDRLSIRVGSPPLPQPLFDGAPLWDIIHPTSSLWTWERGTATKAGLLTVHLDKGHPDTRWSHVFAQEFEVHEVPETLDPSELASIRETLDKYTTSLQENAEGLGHGVPSLAEGERDNEVDSSVGYSAILTWVANDGSTWGPADDSPAVVLSLPLPGANDGLSLVVKNDIDGPLFTFDDAGLVWKHTATYPALAFVLASKRDTRFTFHVSSGAVLAFDSGARNNGGGNVYIYRGCTSGDKWSKQGVFQLQPGAGALLGVGSVSSKGEEQVLLCLSERELTVGRGVFYNNEAPERNF